jgi:hypothetical protein
VIDRRVHDPLGDHARALDDDRRLRAGRRLSVADPLGVHQRQPLVVVFALAVPAAGPRG